MCYLNLKIIDSFWKIIFSILKQIVWETQKMYQNYSRPISSWVIDQNLQNSFSDNLLHNDHSAQNVLNSLWDVAPP